MSALVAPSGECLRGDGRCADRIVSNLAPLYLAAYLLVLVVFGLHAMAYTALSCASAAVLHSVLSSNHKVDD